MKDALDAFSKFIDNLPVLKQGAVYDAETLGTYKKAIRYVRDFKFTFDREYNASPEEQIKSAFNTMCDEVIKTLREQALGSEIKNDRK